ncbi:MAG TPA: hypothetical protein VNA20_12490 [Frankiaceae bacterium]|nr:hypothetical protein [Frankiaceae bacterium]
MRRLLVPLVAASLLGVPAVAAADPNACPAGVTEVRGTQPSYAQISTWLTESAAEHAVPVQVLKAIAYRESEWRQFVDTPEATDPVVISSDHVCGIGIMQITADDRADAVLLASDARYNIDEGAKILAEKWAVSQTTPPPTGHPADDPHAIENWFYAACLYNGCTGDDTYATRIQQLVADPWRRVTIAGIKPFMPIGGFSHPRDDVNPSYEFPSAFQARLPEQDFVFYDHTTGAVTKTAKAFVHDDRAAPPAVTYPPGAYGPDGPGVTCTVCGGWRLAEGKGWAGRAHWTKSVTGDEETRVTWAPPIPRSGAYRVYANVPAVGTVEEPLGRATYRVGGIAVTVDQATWAGKAYLLGTFTLGPGATVWLNDVSDVAGRRIVADAVRFQRVPTVTVAASPALVTYGSATTIRVRLTHGGAPLAGHSFRLYRRNKYDDAGGVILGRYTTDAKGYYVRTDKPLRNSEYFAVYTPPDASLYTARSGYRVVDVRVKVGAALSRTSVPRNTAFTIYASVSPNHAGQNVVLMHYVGGVWRPISPTKLNSTSRASFRASRPAAGTYYFRIYKGSDADHIANNSPTLTVKVY